MSNSYLAGITVVYGDDAAREPAGAITDINNNGNDINKGFGGSYVWLVPTYTADREVAPVSYFVVVQDKSDENFSDLAKGAGGAYRYLLPRTDKNNHEKITEIRLLRSTSAFNEPLSGYSGITSDINAGRGGDYLYLVWKESAVPNTFISGIIVVYGDDAAREPAGAVTDINNSGNDINKGFGGSFVWLTPTYAKDPEGACVSFFVVVEEGIDPNGSDLAKGAGGAYRYLLPRTDKNNHAKITEIRLLRSTSALHEQPSGYSGITSDINADRGGDYLYLIWKASTVESKGTNVAK